MKFILFFSLLFIPFSSFAIHGNCRKCNDLYYTILNNWEHYTEQIMFETDRDEFNQLRGRIDTLNELINFIEINNTYDLCD